MTVKIYLNSNDTCKFVFPDNTYQVLPNGSLSASNESGRVMFKWVESGEPFRNYALSEIKKENGDAYASYEELLLALADFFIQHPERNYPVSLMGGVSDVNTTSTPLGANETYTGEWCDVSVYGSVVLGVISDVDSATNGLKIEYSADGVNTVQNNEYTVTGGDGKTFSFGMSNQYARVKYTNGAIPQTTFSLQTILKSAAGKWSSHRISDNIIGDDDAELVKAVITGRRDDGIFGNALLDNDNRIMVESQSYYDAISEGVVPNHVSLMKFGSRTLVAADTLSTIWEGVGSTYQYLTSAQKLSIVSTSANDASGNTGARTMRIYGLDNSYNEITEVIALAGLTPVLTTQSFIRQTRSEILTCGSAETNLGDVTSSGSVETAKITSIIKAGEGSGSVSIWTVAGGKVAYITQITGSSDTAKGATIYLVSKKMDNAGGYYPVITRYKFQMVGGTNVVPFKIPLKIDEKTDFGLRVKTPSSAGTTACAGTIEFWYENI